MFCFILLFFINLSKAFCQDAQSYGMGDTGTGMLSGVLGLYWNPAVFAYSNTTSVQTVAGFSAWDTSNVSTPILDFSYNTGGQVVQSSVVRNQQYLGLFGLQYQNYGGGVVYDQQLQLQANPDSLAFFQDRQSTLSQSTTYTFNYSNIQQKSENIVLSYGYQVPLQFLPYLGLGGSIKFYRGDLLDETSLQGWYSAGDVTGSNYQYTREYSTNGTGISYDIGLISKVTSSIQIGVLFKNIVSSIRWDGELQTLSLGSNGQETVTQIQDNTIITSLPRETRVGIVLAPPGKGIAIAAESRYQNGKSHWYFGLERSYPTSHLVIRLGTFIDPVSNRRVYTGGIGYQVAFLQADIALLTEQVPNILNSQGLGGAADLTAQF
jgi:hypothetical protein